MALRILGANGGATIVGVDRRQAGVPLLRVATLEQIVLAGKPLEEFACQRHLIGSPNLVRLFLRATGADDE